MCHYLNSKMFSHTSIDRQGAYGMVCSSGLSLSEAQALLDEHHYGLDKVSLAPLAPLLDCSRRLLSQAAMICFCRVGR